MKKKGSIPQKPKGRHHKFLFTHDSPFGHKVQRDRTKYKREKITQEQLLDEPQ